MAMTHCSWDSVACSSRDSVGIATLRLEVPTVTISRLRHSTPRIHHRRAWMRSGDAWGDQRGGRALERPGRSRVVAGDDIAAPVGLGNGVVRRRGCCPALGPTTWYSVTIPCESQK